LSGKLSVALVQQCGQATKNSRRGRDAADCGFTHADCGPGQFRSQGLRKCYDASFGGPSLSPSLLRPLRRKLPPLTRPPQVPPVAVADGTGGCSGSNC